MIRIAIYMMLFSICSFGQSANHTTSDHNSSVTISKVFSPMVLDAYQDQAKAKINDLYFYLNLWSKETDSNTSNEIKSAIMKLLVDSNVRFQNLDNNTSSSLTIDQFLENSKKDKLQFTISKLQQSQIQNNSFEMEYTLEIQNFKSKKELLVSQNIFLYEKEKQFGTHKKRVWELRIGDSTIR